MAKLSTLIRACSAVLGIPEKTVAIYARHLRLARLLSTGGRGRGAAEMIPSDCTNLLIAILGSDLVRQAAEVVSRYRQIRARSESLRWHLTKMPLDELVCLPERHAFGAALDALFRAAKDGSLRTAMEHGADRHDKDGKKEIILVPHIDIAIWSPYAIANIEFRTSVWGEWVRYTEPTPWDRNRNPSKASIRRWERKLELEGTRGDLNQVRQVTAKTILELGELLGR